MRKKQPRLISPYCRNPGYVRSRFNPITGDWVTVYDGWLAHVYSKEGRWLLYCEAHKQGLIHHTLKDALEYLTDVPVEAWCAGCADKKASREDPHE